MLKTKKFIFILGGARSGKSSYALEIAKSFNQKVVFIATAVVTDDEMRERIRLHKLSRPREWELIEEDLDLCSVITGIKEKERIVLIDCLGVFVSNLLINNFSESDIKKRVDDLVNVLLKSEFTVIVVSNEVGTGIVPDNALSRKFRDIIGSVNQVLAKNANQVIYMQCGIPLTIKGKE